MDMSILSQNLVRKHIKTAQKINRGIGYDTYFIDHKKKKYVLRVQNNGVNSRIKIERHIYFLDLLGGEKFTQKIVQKGTVGGRNFFVTNYLPGRPIAKLKKQHLNQINSILNILHLNKFHGSGRFNVKSERGECRSWLAYINSIINRVDHLKQKQSIAGVINLIVNEYREIEGMLKERICNRLLHADLNKENILQDNGKIFFLDWENVIIGDPIVDYAIMNNFWRDSNGVIECKINRKDRKPFLFYKKLFLLLEIFYKIKYKMSFSEDFKKLKDYFI
jgi:Ser/Thr protein kinase RdoA (MazF antagonist)